MMQVHLVLYEEHGQIEVVDGYVHEADAKEAVRILNVRKDTDNFGIYTLLLKESLSADTFGEGTKRAVTDKNGNVIKENNYYMDATLNIMQVVLDHDRGYGLVDINKGQTVSDFYGSLEALSEKTELGQMAEVELINSPEFRIK